MFYSNDLLGKKSPLGSVWIAAHGKKLTKGKVLQVNIGESCKHVMNPEVPQALRLQAILVSGVVIIFNKQQAFLLEDCNEMLKRMRAVSEMAVQGPTLEKKKSKAKAEAITMPNDGMLEDFNLDNLFPSFSTQLLGGPTTSEGPGGSGAAGGGGPQVSDELFVVPTMPEGDTPRHSRHGSGLLLAPEDGPMQLNLEGLERFDLNTMDQPEMFEVPDIDLPGMEAFAPAPAPSPGGDLFPVPDDFGGMDMPVADGEQLPHGQAPDASGGQAPLEGGAAPKAQKKLRKGKGGKKMKAMVDQPDEVQIRGKVYREWMLDRSDLVVQRPQQQAAPAAKSPILVGPASAEMLGAPWPAELMQLFNRNATLPGGEGGKTTKKGGRGAGQGVGGQGEEECDRLEEEERRLDKALLGNLDAGDYGALDANYGYGDLPLPDGPEAGWLGGDEGGEGEGGARAAEANPFRARRAGSRRGISEGTEDIETERLRAALNNTPGSALDAFYLNQLGLTPASHDPLGPANTLTGRGTKRTRGLRPDSEGKLSDKSTGPRAAAGRLSDLGVELEDADMAGMLPVVGEDEPLELGPEEGLAVPPSRKRLRLGGEAGSSGGGTQGLTGGTGTYGTVSQFQLLEESGPGGPTQPEGGAAAAMNHSTMALIGLLRSRFHTLESQGGGSHELSLNEMAAKLTRSEAARLFAQILVTKSNDFIRAKQEEPYGDIIITRGPYL